MHKKKQSKVDETNGSEIENISILEKKEQQPWGNYRKRRVQIYPCYCSEYSKLIKEIRNRLKINRTGLSHGKLLPYQDKIKIKVKDKNRIIQQSLLIQNYRLNEDSLCGQFIKTFQLSYQFPLSRTGQTILNSFTNKYIYYAIDDILCLLDSNPIERDNLLNILYSCMLSLHNEFSINFFDIWIDSVYFNDDCETNRFVKSKTMKTNQTSNLTISLKLHYFKRMPIKKPEPIW